MILLGKYSKFFHFITSDYLIRGKKCYILDIHSFIFSFLLFFFQRINVKKLNIFSVSYSHLKKDHVTV